MDTSEQTLDSLIDPEIKMLPLSAFIRANHRYDGESFEDYRASMKIQGKVRKLMKVYGSQYKIGFDIEANEIHWV